jgi:hypothetical protein
MTSVRLQSVYFNASYHDCRKVTSCVDSHVHGPQRSSSSLARSILRLESESMHGVDDARLCADACRMRMPRLDRDDAGRNDQCRCLELLRGRRGASHSLNARTCVSSRFSRSLRFAFRARSAMSSSSSSAVPSGRPAPAPLSAEELKREEEWKADPEAAFEEGSVEADARGHGEREMLDQHAHGSHAHSTLLLCVALVA